MLIMNKGTKKKPMELARSFHLLAVVTILQMYG